MYCVHWDAVYKKLIGKYFSVKKNTKKEVNMHVQIDIDVFGSENYGTEAGQLSEELFRLARYFDKVEDLHNEPEDHTDYNKDSELFTAIVVYKGE